MRTKEGPRRGRISSRQCRDILGCAGERFPGVSSFEVFRTPDTTDQEWEELGRKFEGHSGKTVAIAFSGAPYASRGGHLAFFGKPKIWMEEVK